MNKNKMLSEHSVNRGKLRLRSQYQALGVQESNWFTMNSQQRKQHLNKLHSISVINMHNRETAMSSEANEAHNLYLLMQQQFQLVPICPSPVLRECGGKQSDFFKKKMQ